MGTIATDSRALYPFPELGDFAMKRALLLLAAGTLLSGACAFAAGGAPRAATEISAITPAPVR